MVLYCIAPDNQRSKLQHYDCKSRATFFAVSFKKSREVNGALEMRFDAYPKRQFVTESININSLADHHIWSNIKTVPATLPEPSVKVRGSSFEAQGPSFTDNGPAVSDRGPRTGVTGAVSQSDLDVC